MTVWVYLCNTRQLVHILYDNEGAFVSVLPQPWQNIRRYHPCIHECRFYMRDLSIPHCTDIDILADCRLDMYHHSHTVHIHRSTVGINHRSTCATREFYVSVLLYLLYPRYVDYVAYAVRVCIRINIIVFIGPMIFRVRGTVQ